MNVRRACRPARACSGRSNTATTRGTFGTPPRSRSSASSRRRSTGRRSALGGSSRQTATAPRCSRSRGRTNRTALVLSSWWEFHDHEASGSIILRPGAKGLSHRSLSWWCERIIQQAGLKRDRQNAHSFRHTYARIALEMGARLEELQRFLGHASIRTTEASYGWLTEQSAATLARARIYGEGLRLVKGPKTGGKRHEKRHKAS
jgi:hypothetical protein